MTQGAPRSYELLMTAELAQAALAPLERALWAQNERLARAVAPVVRVIRALGLVLSGAGVAAVLWTSRSHLVPGQVLGAVILAGFFVLFLLLPRLNARSRLAARRTVARIAHDRIGAVLARVPYAIAYQLGNGRIETSAPKLGMTYALDFRSVKLAIVSERAVCVFRHRFAPSPLRVFYAPTDAELADLEAELRAAGVQILTVTPSAAPAPA